MGRTRGGVGARTLQVALSAARRGDAVMGVGRAKPNCHACKRVGITVSGTALHQTKTCMEVRGEGRASGAGLWRQRPPLVHNAPPQGSTVGRACTHISLCRRADAAFPPLVWLYVDLRTSQYPLGFLNPKDLDNPGPVAVAHEGDL